MARQCYVTAVNTITWKEVAEEVDRALEGHTRLEAEEEVEMKEVVTQDGRSEKVRVNRKLGEEDQKKVRECIQQNIDVFAWSAADMPRIDADVACHRLNLNPSVCPIRQKKRVVATTLTEPILEEVGKLLEAGFVSEIQYSG